MIILVIIMRPRRTYRVSGLLLPVESRVRSVGRSVGLSVGNDHESWKNDRLDQDAGGSAGPKEPYIRWGPDSPPALEWTFFGGDKAEVTRPVPKLLCNFSLTLLFELRIPPSVGVSSSSLCAVTCAAAG